MTSSSFHILVIRLSAMGDVAMTVPVLQRLLAKYPQLELTIVTKPFFASIYKQLPRTRIIQFHAKAQHKGILGILRFVSELKQIRIDAVADLHDVLRTKLLRFFLSVKGIKVKKIDKGRQEKKALIRPSNKVLKQLKTMHQRYADVFENLGFSIDLTEKLETIKFPISQKISIDEEKTLIGIAPFAAHRAKQYPIDSMKFIIEELLKRNDVQLFLFGGGEKELKELSHIAQKFNGIQVVADKLTFEEELQLISNLNLMLSMDSGNGHLAAMFDVPVITIWAGTHPFIGFTPFGQLEENQITPDLNKFPYLPNSVFGTTPLQEYDEIMDSIKTEDILNRVNALIEQKLA